MFSAAIIGIIPQPKPNPFDYNALGALYYFDIASCLKDLQLETQRATPFLRCNDPNFPEPFIDGYDIVSIVHESLITTISDYCRLTPFHNANGIGNGYSKLSLDLVPIIPDKGYRPYEALAFELPSNKLIFNPSQSAYLSFSVAFTLAEDRSAEHTGVAKGFRLEIFNGQSLSLLAKVEDQNILGDNNNAFLEYENQSGLMTLTYQVFT